MRRFAVPFLCLALFSCSSSPSTPPPAKGMVGVESMAPLVPGSKTLGGELAIVSVTEASDGNSSSIVLRATSGAVQAFVHPRWYADATLKREFRVTGDAWLAVRVEAGAETTVRVPIPYPFARTLGLDVARAKPAALWGEGKALPGRLVVTPEQAKQLVLYEYPGLNLTQVEARSQPGAPKLAVWRNGAGKVVAAVEIYVRADAKAAGPGLSFVHTNGKREMSSCLVYSNSKKGAPAEGDREFVIFTQDGREVAVPWKPLVKNASFLGACLPGALGLDAALLGKTAQIGSFTELGASDLETVAVESPSWSMANPTRGSLRSGAPVMCEYTGSRAQRWSIDAGPEMTITGTGGGGGRTCTGTLPAGSGVTELGMLKASRPGLTQFYYESEDLQQDPTCDERLTTSDGPVCPGEDPAAATEILSDTAKPCSSEVPGCHSNPIGSFTELVIPCSSTGGTTICRVDQKDEDPGFVAVACDGDELDDDLGFMAEPFNEEGYAHTWYEIDNGAACAPPADPCVCGPCKLVVVIGPKYTRWPANPGRDELEARLLEQMKTDFDFEKANADPVKVARHQALLHGERTWTRTRFNSSYGLVDPAIAAARNFGEAMAAGEPAGHVHYLCYESLGKAGSSATLMTFQGGVKTETKDCRVGSGFATRNLVNLFANCHKWSEIIFIYHGVNSAFAPIVDELISLTSTPIRRLVFWSCWGGDLISKDSAEFGRLVAHLQAAQCNCPPRRAAVKCPPALHPAALCTACPTDPLHCAYEGTEIICAALLPVTTRLGPRDPEETVDISVPLGIDYVPDPAAPATRGHWVLTSADGTVHVYTVPPEGPVVGPVKASPSPVFGNATLGTDTSLRDRGIERNQDRIRKELERRKKERPR